MNAVFGMVFVVASLSTVVFVVAFVSMFEVTIGIMDNNLS